MKGFLIEVSGTVQGLGFRPFVYNLAVRYGLSGFVRNTGKGVQILVQGDGPSAEKFIRKLKRSEFSASYCVKKAAVDNHIGGFNIIGSKKTEALSDFPADLALCPQCKKELFSKNDRRYRYPFINCVKCGPRFSIIKKLPYDRKNTMMRKFKMCKSCAAEYGAPESRRFHAQPNACAACGPQLYLFSAGNKLLSVKEHALNDAVRLLKKGSILAVKGISGYHLCCDASNSGAVKKLRKRKSRPSKPFAVMADMETAEELCFINADERKELASSAAPIVLLKKRRPEKYKNTVDILAPDNSSLGIMLPYAPLHHLLIKQIPALVMTSGNRGGEPICCSEEEAFENLAGIADFFLVHDRDIENRADDSVVRFLPGNKKKIIIRRSRGYVPVPVKTAIDTDMFAAGGDLKNNFCFVRNGNAYLSQFTGDLADAGNYDFYSSSAGKMKKFLGTDPVYAVCDAHPAYLSSLYASGKYKKIKYAYHHYAHMASVIAEHNIAGKAVGFIFDGNGYGEDGSVWGGEIVLFSARKFSRLACLDGFPLPGGDICSSETWRCAVSALHKHGLTGRIPEHLKKYGSKTIVKMIENGINSPQTSSAGRIFDAVSSLLNIKNVSTFEAEAAVALECLAAAGIKQKYGYAFKKGIIDLSETFEGILNDLDKGESADIISAKFHNTFADIIISGAILYSKKNKTKKIILGGGVFQNMYILDNVVQRLQKLGFKVYFNEQVPLNDGGICLGQAFINKLLLKNK